MLFLLKSSLLTLPSFSLLLVFSILLTFQPPTSSSSLLLFLATLLTKLTSIGLSLPLGPLFPDEPLGPAWQSFGGDLLRVADAA